MALGIKFDGGNGSDSSSGVAVGRIKFTGIYAQNYWTWYTGNDRAIAYPASLLGAESTQYIHVTHIKLSVGFNGVPGRYGVITIESSFRAGSSRPYDQGSFSASGQNGTRSINQTANITVDSSNVLYIKLDSTEVWDVDIDYEILNK